MTARTSPESVMVSICAHLSMSTVPDDSEAMWLSCLREVLADIPGDGMPLLTPMIEAARGLVNSAPGRPRGCAFGRLRYEVREYCRKVSAHRWDQWKDAKEGAA